MDSAQPTAAALLEELVSDIRAADAALRCRLSGGTVGFDDPVTRSEAGKFIRQNSGSAEDRAIRDRSIRCQILRD
jgi:hypothetical protein